MEYMIREQREQVKKAVEDARTILEVAEKEKRELIPSERENIDRIHARIDTLKADIERAETNEEESRAISASLGRKVLENDTPAKGSIEQRKLAAKAWALAGRGKEYITDEMRSAAEHAGIRLDGAQFDTRALEAANTSGGGYSVPNEPMGPLYEFMKWFGSVRSLAQVIRTETGATLPIPTVTDTANSAAITTESSTIASSTDPTFGQATLSSYKYVSPIVKVSIELLRDASFDLPSFLSRMLGTRLGRAQQAAFTTADGSSKPQGVVYGATATTAAATNAYTMDEVMGLTYAVDKAYRDGAVLMAHDTTIKNLRLVKDSENRYLWEPSVKVGAPDVFNGYAVFTNNDMDSALTTGKQLFLFGNLGVGYLIRDVGGPVFAREDHLYWATQQVGFLAYQFSDAKVIDNTAIKRLQLA